MKIVGTVSFRSSQRPGEGPPGESEIQELNPQRKADILRVTGWTKLEAGSLNLEVDQTEVINLGQYAPILYEDGKKIRYPPKYQHIPKTRQGYWYYSGIIQHSGKTEDVLVRRAVNPLPGRVELFSQNSLKDEFGLVKGDRLTVEVVSDPKSDASS